MRATSAVASSLLLSKRGTGGSGGLRAAAASAVAPSLALSRMIVFALVGSAGLGAPVPRMAAAAAAVVAGGGVVASASCGTDGGHRESEWGW